MLTSFPERLSHLETLLTETSAHVVCVLSNGVALSLFVLCQGLRFTYIFSCPADGLFISSQSLWLNNFFLTSSEAGYIRVLFVDDAFGANS